jgi:hypothetical protein
MNEYRYEVYYHYDGPTHSQPFVELKTDLQVREALSNFEHELPHYLNDLEAQISSEDIKGKTDRKNVILKTSEDDDSVEAAVVKCLQSLDLRAHRIKAQG